MSHTSLTADVLIHEAHSASLNLVNASTNIYNFLKLMDAQLSTSGQEHYAPEQQDVLLALYKSFQAIDHEVESMEKLLLDMSIEQSGRLLALRSQESDR